jgi:hypothetical protein
MPGAAFSVEPRGATWEWKVEPPAAGVRLVEPRRGEGANFKVVPGSGFRIELNEEAESKELNPQPARRSDK